MGLTSVNAGTFFLWIAYLALILLGLFVRRSKFYDICFILFMGIVAWLNTDSADIIDVYMPVYLAPQMDWGVEPGWRLLCSIGNALGLTYNGFALILTLVTSTLLVYFARKTTPNESYYLALFLVYPGLLSLVQFRQFVASAIVLMGVLALEHESKGKWAWFTIALMLAFSVHKSSVVMTGLVIMPIYQRIPRRFRWIAVSIGIVLFIEAVSHALEISAFVFGEVKTDAYFRSLGGDVSAGAGGNASSLAVALIDISLTLFLCIFVAHCCRCLARDEIESVTLLKLIAVANAMMASLIPFLFITEDFMRFERYGFILALCAFASMPALRKRHPLFSCKAFLLLICFAFCWMYEIRGATFGAVIGPLLSFEYIPPLFL